MAGLRGLLFDKDGTLIDFHATWHAFMLRLAQELCDDDRDLAEVLLERVGYDTASGRFQADSIVAAGSAIDIAEIWAPFLSGYGVDGLAVEIDRRARGHVEAAAVTVVPLAPFFRRLKGRGLALGIATNDSEAGARAMLRREGAEDLLDFVSGYDSGHGSKSGPGMGLAFARQTGLDPASLAMVGDNLTDLLLGRNAGYALSLGVLTGASDAAALGPFAHAVLPSIAELEAWLEAEGHLAP